jgi:mannose-6-phosphate isomerase
VEPLRLDANTPRSFYRGAGRIHRFRGVPAPDDPYYPEDWVASTTGRYGQAPAGRTILASGRQLAEEIAERPEDWLGPEHMARHGADPAILVKLLDAGQRLPLHVHPDRSYALAHLASPYGKTEAWVIVEAAPDAVVYLGFSRAVAPDELAGWVKAQQIGEMLAATNRVPVHAGDAVLVPAGLPHAIGPGILLVEVQEPTDFSVLLEWEGFAVPESAAYLGLSRDEALGCVDRGGWGPDQLAGLTGVPGAGRPLARGTERLFGTAADEFFAAERLRPDPVSVLDPGFSILVVVAGSGVLEWAGGRLPVARGDTLLLPYAAGACRLTGAVEAIRCRPALTG